MKDKILTAPQHINEIWELIINNIKYANRINETARTEEKKNTYKIEKVKTTGTEREIKVIKRQRVNCKQYLAA